MKTKVIRGNVEYYCTTEEQLKIFLDSGYSVVNDTPAVNDTDIPAEPKPKKPRKSK